MQQVDPTRDRGVVLGIQVELGELIQDLTLIAALAEPVGDIGGSFEQTNPKLVALGRRGEGRDRLQSPVGDGQHATGMAALAQLRDQVRNQRQQRFVLSCGSQVVRAAVREVARGRRAFLERRGDSYVRGLALGNWNRAVDGAVLRGAYEPIATSVDRQPALAHETVEPGFDFPRPAGREGTLDPHRVEPLADDREVLQPAPRVGFEPLESFADQLGDRVRRGEVVGAHRELPAALESAAGPDVAA